VVSQCASMSPDGWLHDGPDGCPHEADYSRMDTRMTDDSRLACDEVVGQISDMPAKHLVALVAAAKGGSPVGVPWPIDERYWFSGTANARFTHSEDDGIRSCWTRVLQVLADQYVARDVRRRQPGRLMAWFDRIAQPRENIRMEGDAAGVLERVFGDDVWYGVTVIWNACCAALLASRLSDDLRTSLERGWRLADIGPTPLDRLRAANPRWIGLNG
jgi:hypothetical protein